MKSVKPGRGPSMMSGIGSVAAAVFGVIWTLTAVNMGAPVFFPLFGVVFVLLGVAQAVYNFRNATGEDRHSLFDITDAQEEGDPLARRYGRPQDGDTRTPPAQPDTRGGGYCPFCGEQVQGDYNFCRRCGKQLN